MRNDLFSEIKEKIFENKFYYLILIVFNSIYYLILIQFNYRFSSDDFYLYSIITKYSEIHISLNPNEAFYLFLRPVSYFFFWLDFKLFSLNPYYFKISALILHLVFMNIIYTFLIYLSIIFTKKRNQFLLFILTLLFSVNTFAYQWVTWISMKNELLMFLFYIISIFLFVFYNERRESKYFILSVAAYSLALMSKQTCFHYPILLLIILLYFKNSFNIVQIKKNINYLIVVVLIKIIFAAINILYLPIEYDVIFVDMWKKPFALLGSIVNFTIPILGNKIYTFFLVNKVFAVFLFLSTILIIFNFFVKMKNVKKRKIAIFWILSLISAYIPQMLATSGDRSGVVAYLIIIIIFVYYSKDTGKSTALTGVIILLILLNIVNSLYLSYNSVEEYNNDMLMIKKLETTINNNNDKNILIISNPNNGIMGYKYNYYLNNNLRLPHFKIISIYNKRLNIFPTNQKYIDLKFDVTGNIITVSSQMEDLALVVAGIDNDAEFKIIKKVPNPIRYHSSITLDLLNINTHNLLLIYWNGYDWIKIDNNL